MSSTSPLPLLVASGATRARVAMYLVNSSKLTLPLLSVRVQWTHSRGRFGTTCSHMGGKRTLWDYM